MENILGQKIKITQIKSASNLTKIQKANIFGLGLKKIGSSVEITCLKESLGMINKVSHLVKIETIETV